MKNIFLCLTKANATLKTGGGNSQIFKHFWQYAACLLLAFVLGIGNVWGADKTFTVEGPAVSKRYMQDKILVSGTVNASKKIANGSNGPVFYLQNGNYAPLQIVSKSANIKKIEIYGNRDTGSNSQATAFNVQTSSDAISFSVPTTGFTAKATNNSTETNVNSLSGVTMIGNNQSYATTITVTFTSPVMAIRLVGTASVSIKRVVITYDDAITPTPELCEVHMTSTSAATLSGTIGTWTKTNLTSGYTYTDTKATPNNYYFNKSSGTYGYIDLGEGNAFAKGDEIWLEISGGSTLRAPSHGAVTTKLNKQSDSSGDVSVQPTCSIAVSMPTYVRYITQEGDPWVGNRYLYIKRGNSDHSVYQVTIHRASGGGDPTPTTYTVTYDGNGNTSGDVPTDSNSPYEEGDEVTVLGNTNSLARTGYTFSGWNTEADGTGDTYAADAKFDMGTSNVTLYAKWTLNLSTHSAGTYETDAGSGGYGLTLKTYSGRDYEIYTFNTSKLYAGSSVTSSDGKEMLTAVANKDVAPSDTWLLVRPSAVNDGGDSDSPAQFAFTSETANDRKTHYVSIKNTDYIKLKVSGYDQFTFFGRDNGTSDGKKFVVKIDGAVQTFDHNSTDNTLYHFTLTTETHLIEVTADGTNACRFRGFSLRLPEVSCDATVPGDISAGDLTDGEITLTAEGSAETGDTWYWQSASDGTSTSDEYDAENGKTVDAAGTYYLRSYNTAGTCWSTAKSITLTAEDFVAHYAITYNKGAYGSGDAIAAGDKTEDEDFTLSSSMFTREGYVQVGWATSDGGSKAYDLGGTYSDNAALILYPVWAPKDTYVAAFEYDSESPAAPARWEFSTGDHTSTSNSADYVPTFGSEYPGDGPSDANYIAFAKGGSAYAIYDLGYSTTVSQITATLYGGSSSDVSIDIQYLGADKSTVKNTYTAKAKNWGSSHTDAVSNDVVANVRYIKVKGASKWVVLSAFSVTYGDLTPKYTVTYVPNNGVEPAETMTDSDSPYKAGTEVSLLTNTFTAPATKEFDAWVVTPAAGGDPITITNGKFTMPSANVNVTATWKTPAPKYGVTYVLNGPTGDAPTETAKEAGAEFALAAAPSWSGHVFQGWKWTDNSSVDHVEEAEADFTMPAYAVTFTAQWKLENDAAFSNKVAFENAEVALGSLFTSSSDGTVTYALKVASETASISGATFTATAAGEYVVVASQAATDTYAATSKEATIEVLETEVEDIFIFNKKADYGGDGKCLTADQANTEDGVHQYTAIAYEGFTGMGRAEADNTECILTFSVKPAYSSALSIKNICTYGKFEEPLGGQISWDGGTSWEDLAAYTDGKKEFDAPGTFPTSFKIKFMGVSKKSGGLWWRNALVTLEKKKSITNTAIDLTAVKINNVAISAANLTTLKTADAYALDLSDEYVTAPTVKFNKLTVITYEDASEVESNVEIPVVASVNAGGKWEAQTEINAITYTVTMAKADAFIVNYYQADGETLIGSENVAVNGNPTGTGFAPTPIDYKESYWTLNSAEVALNTVTSDEAGTIINLVAAYRTAYASSINIEKWVLDNRKNNTAFRAVLDARHYQYANLNDLDSLTTEKNDGDRNYPFLGQKIKTTGGYISFLLKAGSEMHVKFGNIPATVNLIVNDGEPVAKSASFDYTAGGSDEIIKLATTTDGTVVFKQIMIDEAIETVVLPAIVTYDANGGSFAKTSEKYTGTPLVIGDATPANPTEYEFEGWHLGSVEGTKIDAAAYEPTKNVTLVAKYVAKPSPFSLIALTYQIGSGDATAVGYVEGTYEYTVKLPYAPLYETITVAYTLAEGTSSVKAGAVLDVTSVPGAATFTVIAANETEKTYTVNFKKEAKDGLEIIGATVSTNTTADMSGLYGGTASVNLNSKKIDNGGYIYITLPSGYTFEETDVLVVNVNTKADIGTKALEITTGVGNIDGEVWKTIAFDDYSTGNNTIALTGIVANQTSIGLKRSSNQNAKINSLKVYRPMNPVLKSITFDGTKIDVTGLTVEETLPYSADLTAVTPEIFWNGAGTAVVTTNAGAWAWGDNTYVLTDKDGDATTYTITLVRAERSSDKSLSSLTVDGNAVELKEGVYDYIYEYPYGTDPAKVPVVAAVANDAHASVGTITQAATASGTASFTVTAEDETTQDYTVRFCISRNQTLVIYDGKESEPMNAIANPGSLEPGLEWTIKDPNSTSASSADAVVFEGKSYKKYVQLFTSATKAPNEGNTRYMTITVPENYLAKFRLVGCGNGSGDRSLFISKEITGTLDESIAFVHTTSATITGMTSDYQYPGTYYLCCDASIRIYELSVTLYPIDYTRNVTDGRFGTICLQHGGVMRGAAVYEVAYFNPDNKKIYFDEVLSGEMVPGMPYVFLPDQGNNDQLVVTYGNNAAAAEAGHHNGLYGSFTEELLAANTVNYILQSNQYWYVNSGEVYVGENRAYFKVAEIYGYQGEPEPTPAQGRRRVMMDAGAQAPQTPTGLDNVQGDNVQSAKVLIDGKMYILRGEKMYDATGRLVK